MIRTLQQIKVIIIIMITTIIIIKVILGKLIYIDLPTEDEK